VSAARVPSGRLLPAQRHTGKGEAAAARIMRRRRNSNDTFSSGTSGSATNKLVNQTYSKQLRTAFGGYLDTLALPGINGYGTLTAENYADYMLKQYLAPAATKALGQTLTAAERETYLTKNTWITCSGGQAAFT